jgi:hypothetical protein
MSCARAAGRQVIIAHAVSAPGRMRRIPRPCKKPMREATIKTFKKRLKWLLP